MVRNLEEKAVFVRSLANEVLRRCTAENVVASFDLCAYLVDLMVLQQSGDCTINSLAENIIKVCVNYLKDEPLSIKTIKVQINWQEKYQSRDEIKRIHHERILGNVFPIMSEITEINQIEKEHFYKKIAVLVIMFAGLGSPTQQLIIKETQAALLSIFKASEVENFLNLPKAVKEQQLVEFARLITGIVLFNKDCKKGGEGMDDLPLILTQGVRATKERLISFKDQLMKVIDHINNGLSTKDCFNEKGDSAEVEGRIPEQTKCRDGHLEKLKTLLIHYTQLKYYTNDLMRDLEKSFIVVKDLVERLQTTLLQLHRVVRYRVAVTTAQVFPLFIRLSDIWVEMQEEVDIISEINNNFMDLSFATKSLLPAPADFNPPSSEDMAPPSDDEIHDSLDFYPGVKVCHFSTLSGEEQLQYEGFCAWTLASMEGSLLPGNIQIGVMQFSNRYYIFSSPEAARKWALDPIRQIKTVLKVTRTYPELIRLLNLYEDLESNFLEHLKTKEDEKPSSFPKTDAFVQTDLHPLQSHINRDYTFSEWELKRKAIRLATLTRCVTRSQQTVKKGCFRSEVAIQVTPHATTSTQTSTDGFCNHSPFPKSTNYQQCIYMSGNDVIVEAVASFLIPAAAASSTETHVRHLRLNEWFLNYGISHIAEPFIYLMYGITITET